MEDTIETSKSLLDKVLQLREQLAQAVQQQQQIEAAQQEIEVARASAEAQQLEGAQQQQRGAQPQLESSTAETSTDQHDCTRYRHQAESTAVERLQGTKIDQTPTLASSESGAARTTEMGVRSAQLNLSAGPLEARAAVGVFYS